MKSTRFINSIAFFFWIFFIISKISGLHVFAHDHDSDHVKCVVCQMGEVNNITPAQLPEIAFIPEHIIQLFLPVRESNAYNFVYTQDLSYKSIFCRPPPASFYP